MEEHDELVRLLEELITAVSTDYWASVILLVVLLVVLVGGLILMYIRVKANERMMLMMLSKLNGKHPVLSDLDMDDDNDE